MGATDQSPAVAATLVGEATRKAGLVWLAYGNDRDGPAPRPAWHVWVDGCVYVVTGTGEQDLPGLADAAEVTVVVPSKDTRGRVVTWIGRAETVGPRDADWAAATTALAAGRLNAEGGAAMIDRWARECTVVKVTPAGDIVETADDPSPGSLAQPPRQTAATTLGRQPYMLGGVRRRRR